MDQNNFIRYHSENTHLFEAAKNVVYVQSLPASLFCLQIYVIFWYKTSDMVRRGCGVQASNRYSVSRITSAEKSTICWGCTIYFKHTPILPLYFNHTSMFISQENNVGFIAKTDHRYMFKKLILANEIAHFDSTFTYIFIYDNTHLNVTLKHHGETQSQYNDKWAFPSKKWTNMFDNLQSSQLENKHVIWLQYMS